jgi:hypothetical protein
MVDVLCGATKGQIVTEKWWLIFYVVRRMIKFVLVASLNICIKFRYNIHILQSAMLTFVTHIVTHSQGSTQGGDTTSTVLFSSLNIFQIVTDAKIQEMHHKNVKRIYSSQFNPTRWTSFTIGKNM